MLIFRIYVQYSCTVYNYTVPETVPCTVYNYTVPETVPCLTVPCAFGNISGFERKTSNIELFY